MNGYSPSEFKKKVDEVNIHDPTKKIFQVNTEQNTNEYESHTFVSLESGLHSVLTALNLPISSEVLITSLVSPSIINIIELHGLIAKPIDINLETMEIISDIENVITNKTKLLIIGHLFGLKIDININNFINELNKNNILIIEDCSNTYPYDGSKFTDIKLYNLNKCNSIINYKINGALFKFKSINLLEKVKSITNGYSKQSAMHYFFMFIILYVLKPLQNRFISKIFIKICHVLSIRYDQWFIYKKYNIKQLEIQPSSYLNKMINKRINNRRIRKKIKEKRSMILSTLTSINDIIIIGKSCNNTGSCNAFPICITDKYKNKVINKMRSYGYNIMDGKTKLNLISVSHNNINNNNYFETNVIYLPFNNMDIKSFKKMLTRLKKLFNKNNKRINNKIVNILHYVFKILIAFFILKYTWFYLLIIISIAYYFLRPTRIFRDVPYKGIKHKRIINKDEKICAIVTGSTGFVGEVLVKDLLDSYPSNMIKLYLIIRGKKNASAQDRAKKLFNEYMTNNKYNIEIIDAELGTLNINNLYNENKINDRVTHIIHAAGNVRFNDTHSNVAKINIECTLKLKQLSEKYNAKFIFVSTAFVHGSDYTKKTNYINSSPVHLSDDISAFKLYKLMSTNRIEIDEYMKSHHIRNNYILSKMVAENLIGNNSIIIRPTIVGPSWNFPEPGWAGRTPSTITLVLTGAAGRLLRAPIKTSLRGLQSMPVVPVDFVTKTIIENINNNSNKNNIYLAALNTNTKYNRLISFSTIGWPVTSYIYNMEIITSIEVVLIRLCVLIAAMFGDNMFEWFSYVMNEIFAPKQYKQIVRVVPQFTHFASINFEVSEGITPNIDFDGSKYLTMCLECACEFAKKPIYDLAATIPFKYDFNFILSITNTCFSYILSKTCNKVVIDKKSIQKLQELSGKKNIVLLPTHRAFYDFLLMCKICVKYQSYGLSMPLSFATSKFKQSLPIAKFMSMMNTVFIDSRSNNIKSGFLSKKIKQNMNKNNVYQLFIEGTRSRNRKFLKPHHGALSVLIENMDVNIVPISINYERISEQNLFYKEFDGEKHSFSVSKLFKWFYDVVNNNIFLGDIHIGIGDVMYVKKQNYNKEFFNNLVNEIQIKQMEMTTITKYHIKYFENKHKQLNIEKFLNDKGCKVYETTLKNQPENDKEICMLTMQFAHYIADYLDENTNDWLTNGNIIGYIEQKEEKQEYDDESIKQFLNSIQFIIDEYKSNYYVSNDNNNKRISISDERIQINDESLGYWGYHDCYFCLKSDKLFFQGSKYEISGKFFNKTISFLSELSNIPLLRKKKYFSVMKRIQINDNNNALILCLIKLFGKNNVTNDINIRYRHGTGHTVADMINLRIENSNIRIPDVVICPENSDQLINLINEINDPNNKLFYNNICLIPYGGGTNVTMALQCPSKNIEKRKIISVDMKLMNKVIWINRENQTAKIEAGITGKKLEKELNNYGFTSGHYPDSYEFSTLGGWIATYASGMKRTKYGNIEEIVIDFEVITALGLINRNMIYGRVSAGINPLLQFYGSEGNLGIIINAVIRLHKLPDIVSYDSIVFPNWNNGINMMKMVKNVSANCRPAVCRLVDNTQFKLSQTFKSESHGVHSIVSNLLQLYITKWKGFDVNNMCAATIVYEGTKNEIKIQRDIMNKLIKQNNGILGGEQRGKAGFALTFAIAYIRDFLLDTFGILAESFETFIPWDKINNFQQNLHENILKKHKNIGLIGNPFLSSRISQIYNEGVCLYLYYGFYVENINKNSLKIFDEMEEFIRQQMLKLGGSISHHHGIGKLRSNILKNNISSKEIIQLTENVKNAFDPNNIFCANNGLLNEDENILLID